MSLELFEVCGLVAALVALTALFHRVVQPLLRRLVQGPLDPAGAPGVEIPAHARLERGRLGSPA